MSAKPEPELVGAFCALKGCLDSEWLSLDQMQTILRILGIAHQTNLDMNGATKLSETLECKEYINRLLRAHTQ
jgi:hypothetical protein